MAQIIFPEGRTLPVDPADGRVFSFREFYKIIGCEMVEQLDIGNGVVLTIDEEGKFKQHSVNTLATGLARRAIFPGDYIAGIAVLSTREEAGFEDEDEEDYDDEEVD